MVFITSQSVNSEILRQQGLSRDIATFQLQVSSGKKFDAPSDNPQDWLQISTIGRQQSLTAAWEDNLKFAQSRAAQASSGLGDVNNLMSRVTELLVTSTSTSPNSPGTEAIAVELEGIRDSIAAILTQTDYQGTPTFDDGTSVAIPIGKGMAVDAVATRQSVEEGISTASGPKTIYEVLDGAIAAVRSGDNAARNASLTEARSALDHVIVAQSKQGVRTQRLDDESSRILDANLQLAERRSGLEDADLTEVIAKLQAKLVTLQAAQTVYAKINQQSLFTLIR
ncbi:MAG TPA: flagellin [Sphingobium sp.]|nr:flagellin [Sphingobium sp.]